MIDELKIKLNPLLLGDGTPLFGASQKTCQLNLLEQSQYDRGLQIIHYQMAY